MRIEIRAGDTSVFVQMPETPREWHELTGLRIKGHDIERMQAIFKAGAVSALREMHNTRGARLEAALLGNEKEMR